MAGTTVETKKAPAAEKGDTTLALVAYILGWLSGLIVFLVAKDKLAKFHGMQSLILGLLGLIPYVITFGLLWPITFLLWLYGLYVGVVYAYKGERYKIPYIGEYAAKYSS